MALGDPYATLAQLKARLNISDTNDDAPLTNALSSASRALEGCCGRQFNDVGPGNESARVYYPDSLTVVSTEDFQSSAGLVVAADYSNAGTYTTIIASSNYQLEPLNGIFDGTTGWPYYRIRAIQTWYPLPLWSVGDPRASIQVTARWGWALVPANITEACLIIAEETFKLKDIPFGVAGIDPTGYALRVAKENPQARALYSRYVRSPILVA